MRLRCSNGHGTTVEVWSVQSSYDSCGGCGGTVFFHTMRARDNGVFTLIFSETSDFLTPVFYLKSNNTTYSESLGVVLSQH